MSQFPIEITEFSQLAKLEQNVYVAIGMFDGVHLGHKKVIQNTLDKAKANGALAVVLTFWPHPSQLLRPKSATSQIYSPERKTDLLFQLGVDVVLMKEFDVKISSIEAIDFVDYLKKEIPNLAGISVGENFRFGKGRSGTIETLTQTGKKLEIEVDILDRFQHNKQAISSSRIRECLQEGKIADVNNMLGHSYQAIGKAIPGKKIGRSIGFPTINVEWNPDHKPCFGVYCVQVHSNGKVFDGVANYGLRPSIDPGESHPLLEIHILSEEIPDESTQLLVQFQEFLRKEKEFHNLEALKEQILRDKNTAIEYFS